MTTISNITITTFVNPHLFWIIKSQNANRLETLKTLQKEMSTLTDNVLSTLDHSFEVGQVVAVEFKKQMYRAMIETTYCNGYSEENKKEVNSYCQCWLIDHGVMVEVDKIYKLPISLRNIPPLALQVCINNIGYIQQHISYDQKGQPMLENVCSTVSNPRCRQKSTYILSNFQTLDLLYDYKEGGIYFGDIICRDADKVISLKTELIKAEVIEENEDVFNEIKAGINEYRENHLRIIYTICKNNVICLEENKHDKIDLALEKIKRKHLNEFGDNEDSVDEEVHDMINKRRHLRSKTATSESSESFNSSDDLLNNTISDTSRITESPKLSSREKLMEFIKQKRLSSAPNENKGSEENVICHKIKSDNRIEFIDIDGSTSNISGFESNSEDMSSRSFEVKKRTQHNFDKNIMFLPAGANCATPRKSSKKNTFTVESKSIENSIVKGKKLPENIPRQRTSKQTSKTDKLCESFIQQKNDTVNSPAQLTLKPHCKCRQCEHWTDSKNWIHTPEYSMLSEKRLTKEYKHSFFKKGYESQISKIQSIDFNEDSNLKKKSKPMVLVHSEVVPTPVKSIYNVSFHPDVLNKLLELNYKESKKIQLYTWHALLRNHSIFMVHGPQTGKTMGYLPLMCTFLLEKEERYQHIMKIGGPIIVILCANSKKCEDIHYLAKTFLGNNRTKVSIVTYPNSSTPLHNTDMLITTPTILIDLLKSHKISFKRLCHFILEDGSQIMKKNDELLKKIFNLIDNMLENRKFSKSVQLVICAEHWNARLEKLLNTLKMLPLVCIGNYLEASLYGGMKFSMKFFDSSCKGQEMITLLRQTYTIHKTIIFCDSTELEELEVLLLLKGINAVIMAENVSQEGLNYLEESWVQSRGGQYTVLVCTDFVFNTMMSVTCASILIHYSLPQSWTKFLKRFSSLLESCRSPVDPNEGKGTCQSIVFCDENSENQMHKFFRYFNGTDLKYQLPEKLRSFSQTLKIMEEENRIRGSIELCSNLKLFGKCIDVDCSMRHLLSENLDVCKSVPKTGRVRFKIVDVIDLTCFSIQIIQHIDDENNVNFYDEFKDITEDLNNSLHINKKAVTHLSRGCCYAFYNSDEDELFYRCRVLEIKNDLVKIILIDVGEILNSVKSRIFELPKEFVTAHYPQKTLEMYLSNYIPPYQDECFSSKAFSMFKHELEQIDYKNKIFHGVIALQLGNVLWLNDVYEETFLSDKSIIRGLQLAKQALTLELVQFNQNQLKRLEKLCETVGITVPEQAAQLNTVPKKKNNITPQWAYLEQDKPNEVIFSSAISPEEIYFRLSKFDDLLYMLQKDIQIAIKRPNYPKLESIDPGDVCLAHLPNEHDYHRAIISKSELGKALCFFVDFGDEAVVSISDLKHIEDRLIKQLPFQSIQCSLHGIKPVLKEWQDDSTNILYDYGCEPQSDIFRSLYAKTCMKGTSSVKGQNNYSILLKDGFGEKQILVNKLLVDCGLACPNSEDIVDFEIPHIQVESVDDTKVKDEMNEVSNILRKTEELAENFYTASNSTMIETFDGDFVVDDPVLFFKEILDLSKPSEHITNRELPTIKAADNVDYCTPQVYWYQTETAVRISVKIADARDCYIHLSKNRILSFRAKRNDQLYSFKLMLYEPVESLQQILSETDIRVTLIKSKLFEWPRLILSKQRSKNIHYDLTKLKYEEKHKLFLEIPKEVDDGLESDDDVIDMMYNVCSDLESDYDQDLENDSD